MLCPCGSALSFSLCCQPLIDRTEQTKHVEGLSPSTAKTAEQLMRSRFSAYATKNGQYIYDTYAQATKLKQSLNDIQQWANECTWVALEVHQTNTNTVDFSAYYIVDNTMCCLRELSNFVIEKGLWRYVDGHISSHEELTKIKQSDICPCNDYSSAFSAKKGKKYKHCCGR